MGLGDCVVVALQQKKRWWPTTDGIIIIIFIIIGTIDTRGHRRAAGTSLSHGQQWTGVRATQIVDESKIMERQCDRARIYKRVRER